MPRARRLADFSDPDILPASAPAPLAQPDGNPVAAPAASWSAKFGLSGWSSNYKLLVGVLLVSVVCLMFLCYYMYHRASKQTKVIQMLMDSQEKLLDKRQNAPDFIDTRRFNPPGKGELLNMYNTRKAGDASPEPDASFVTKLDPDRTAPVEHSKPEAPVCKQQEFANMLKNAPRSYAHLKHAPKKAIAKPVRKPAAKPKQPVVAPPATLDEYDDGDEEESISNSHNQVHYGGNPSHNQVNYGGGDQYDEGDHDDHEDNEEVEEDEEIVAPVAGRKNRPGL